jgi:hypothetical protein
VAARSGFRETADSLKVFQNEAVKPTWWEKLCHMYDTTDYAANLYNCPTVAYSGEVDRQMEADSHDGKSARGGRDDIEACHRAGTAHKYHPDSKIEINRIVDALAERGRDPLEYNRMNGSRSMHSISIGSGRDWMRRLWAIRRCR